MPDLSTCWQIAEAKSGSAYALACYVGTRTATQQSDRLCHLENFGRSLGTIVQISDDIEDLERDISRSGKKNMLSPLANAYLAHFGANLGEIAYRIFLTPSKFDRTMSSNNGFII